MLLEKLPAPSPSEVLLSAIVGVVPVLQHIPRLVTVAPPSSVIFPPLVAEVGVIFEPVVVVKMGIIAFFSF